MGKLSFEVAAKAEHDPADIEVVEFTIGNDPYEYKAFRPTSSQISLFGSASSSAIASQDRLAAIFEFLKSILANPADYTKIRARLNDRDDAFDIYAKDGSDGLITVLAGVISYWTGFPTQPSSPSAGTPAPTGARSTGRARAKASTPST
jgi:hypothetical protein